MTTMFKDLLADAMLEECRIIQHLYGKIPEGGMDYRPSPDQRSTLELLRYIATMGEAATTCIVTDNWDQYSEIAEQSKEMMPDEFPQLMDSQIKNLKALLDPLTDEDITTRMTKHITGREVTLAEGLLGMPLKWLTGYRMQLFLYAKQAGNSTLSTPNCWIGVDPKKD